MLDYRAARSCLRDWSSDAFWRAFGSRAPSPAFFGAFALLDGPRLTQFKITLSYGLGFWAWGLGIGVLGSGFRIVKS